MTQYFHALTYLSNEPENNKYTGGYSVQTIARNYAANLPPTAWDFNRRTYRSSILGVFVEYDGMLQMFGIEKYTHPSGASEFNVIWSKPPSKL
jgi:hypothetical protein